jgi:hypothetical protein
MTDLEKYLDFWQSMGRPVQVHDDDGGFMIYFCSDEPINKISGSDSLNYAIKFDEGGSFVGHELESNHYSY